MSLAYLDTHSGIAGDMLLAALVDAGADVEYLKQQLSSLPGMEQVELEFSPTFRHCFRALRLDVRHPPEHAHRHLSDIEAMLAAGRLAPREQELAQRLFRRLGGAEAKVHGTTLEEVHFHEVGAIDSIVDIVGIAVALNQLQIRRIVASATPTGTGTINIAHGLVSLPAPATAELLRGIPIRGTSIEAELTTPTGAAVLATVVDGFGPLPDMQLSRIGYGAGHKELKEQANVLRVLIGTPLFDEEDEVLVLETNVDDCTGEQLGFALEKLWQQQPLDVFTTAIGMKKNRPATMISVICVPNQRTRIEDILFRHTGSLGVRRTRMSRRKLRRESFNVTTPLGTARVKVAWIPEESTWPASQSADDTVSPRMHPFRTAPEYEDCRELANASGQSLHDVFRIVSEHAQRELSHRNASQHSLGEAPASQLPKQNNHSHDHSHDHHHH